MKNSRNADSTVEIEEYIQEELRYNGSPKAIFETDDERRAVTVEIPIHPDFLVEQADLQAEPQNEPQNEPQRLGALEEAILNLIRLDGHVTRDEMASQMKVQVKVAIGLSNSNKIEAWFCHHASTSFSRRDQSSIRYCQKFLLEHCAMRRRSIK